MMSQRYAELLFLPGEAETEQLVEFPAAFCLRVMSNQLMAYSEASHPVHPEDIIDNWSDEVVHD